MQVQCYDTNNLSYSNNCHKYPPVIPLGNGVRDKHHFPSGSDLPVNDNTVLVKKCTIEKSEFSPNFVQPLWISDNLLLLWHSFLYHTLLISSPSMHPLSIPVGVLKCLRVCEHTWIFRTFCNMWPAYREICGLKLAKDSQTGLYEAHGDECAKGQLLEKRKMLQVLSIMHHLSLK